MPYIEKKRRKELDEGDVMCNSGELHYMIAEHINDYLNTREKVDYQAFNDVFGVLSLAGHELFTRKVKQYEELKCEKNGDVYSNYS